MEKPKMCWSCYSERLKLVRAQGREWWRCQRCGSATLAQQQAKRQYA